MRLVLVALATLSTGCQCQDYHIVPLSSKHADWTVTAPPTDGVGVPRSPRPDGGRVPRSTWPRLDLPHVRRPPAPPVEDDACAAQLPPVDTSNPASPYAPATWLPGTCVSSVVPTWRSGTLRADDHGVDGPWGWLDVPRPGVYHLYGPPLARDAAGVLRVPTIERRGGRPVHANCGTDWVVAAPPPETPDGVLVYLGTFALEAGPNPVQLRHACTVPEAVGCSDVDEVCGGPEVVLRGRELCVVAAD
jgi:hypothetical protein